ncbi:MAG: DNA-binding response regulator [Bacteroidetes bacterium]|nr:MAG: DNA-binding response regulator [Bacteroidota bacterium]
MINIRILIADAAFLVREGLKAVIAGYPYMQVVGEASYSDELRQRLEQCQPHVVIMDHNAPGAFSVEDVRYVHELAPAARILMISSGLSRESVFQVLEAGAKGFLLKECDETEILGAIRALRKNEKFFCGKVLDLILERDDPAGPRNNCEPTRLTERETEIVRLMAEGMSTQEMADRLSLSVHTIYTHRKNVMRKLGLTTAAEVILYAINSALVQPGPRV